MTASWPLNSIFSKTLSAPKPLLSSTTGNGSLSGHRRFTVSIDSLLWICSLALYINMFHVMPQLTLYLHTGIARLLHSLAEMPRTSEAERAWKQVDLIFHRHLGDDMAMHDVPSWRLIERLCDIAMFAHSSCVHQGAAYTLRGKPRQGNANGETTTSTGLSLVSQLAYSGFGAVSYNDAAPGESVAHADRSNDGNMMQYTSTESDNFQP